MAGMLEWAYAVPAFPSIMALSTTSEEKRMRTINTIIKGQHIRAYVRDDNQVQIDIDDQPYAECKPEDFSTAWGLAKVECEHRDAKKKES